MNKVSEIFKKTKAELENAKIAEFNTRFGQHYNNVVAPHLQQLDKNYNDLMAETKKKLEAEKQAYSEEQRKIIKEQIEAEFAAAVSAIEPMIEKEV